jgi:hypothetical protein
VLVAGGIQASCHLNGTNHSDNGSKGLSNVEQFSSRTMGSWVAAAPGLATCRTLFSAASGGSLAAFTGGEGHHSTVLASGELWQRHAGGKFASNPLPLMSTPRMSHGSAIVDGVLYVMGGKPADGTATTEKVESLILHPLAKSWMPEPSLPSPRFNLRSVAVSGTVFIFGGTNRSDTGPQHENVLTSVIAFTPSPRPSRPLWLEKMPLPTPRYLFGVGAVGARVFVIGGALPCQPSDGCRGQTNLMRLVEVYDTVHDRWQQFKPSLPAPRFMLQVAVLGDTLLVIGGANHTRFPDGWPCITGAVDALNVSDASAGWQAKASLDSPRCRFAATTIATATHDTKENIVAM